jgi:hypothetical protein
MSWTVNRNATSEKDYLMFASAGDKVSTEITRATNICHSPKKTVLGTCLFKSDYVHPDISPS